MNLGKLISVNEKGYEFYIDEMCDGYATQNLGKKYRVLIIAKDGEPIERVLMKNNEPIYSHTSFESVVVHIDMLRAIKERNL